MKKITRRELLKLGVVTAGTALVASKIATPAFAADCDDSKITQQDYVSDANSIDSKNKSFAKFESGKKSLVDACTKAGKSTSGLMPHCANCKQYKEKTAGCGTCPMVGANGQPGKFVKANGWCKVYMADASKVK